MNTKRALIIGGLTALLIGLFSFAIQSKEREQKRQEIESKYAEITPKMLIQTDKTTSGYLYEIDTNKVSEHVSIYEYTSGTQFTYNTPKPNNILNTTWTFKDEIDQNYLSDINEGWNLLFMARDYQLENIYFDEYGIFYVEQQSNPILAYATQLAVQNEDAEYVGWQSEDYQQIYIEGGETTNTTLINILYNISYHLNDIPYYANEKTETLNTTYNSITYKELNQKQILYNQYSYTNYTIISEGLFLLKTSTPQIASGLFLTDARFNTGIENYQNIAQSGLITTPVYATFQAEIKISKLQQLQLNTNNLYKEFNSYKNFYEQQENKTNIYSGNWTWNSSPNNTDYKNGTYWNESGNRIATIQQRNWEFSWQISNEDINIQSAGVNNCLLVYYKMEYKNEQDITNNLPIFWVKPASNVIGETEFVKGYAIGEQIVAPPDIEDGEFTSLTDMMLNILTMPFTFIVNAFNITLWADTPWAFNIRNFILVIIAIMAFLFVIKIFTSGFSIMGNFTNNVNTSMKNREREKMSKHAYKQSKTADKVNKQE